MDRGYDVRAIVHRIKGADIPDSTLRLVMRLSMDPNLADEPELPGTDQRLKDEWASNAA